MHTLSVGSAICLLVIFFPLFVTIHIQKTFQHPGSCFLAAHSKVWDKNKLRKNECTCLQNPQYFFSTSAFFISQDCNVFTTHDLSSVSDEIRYRLEDLSVWLMFVLLCLLEHVMSVCTLWAYVCLALIPGMVLQSFIIQHMVCVLCVWLCVTVCLIAYLGLLQRWATVESILTIPGPLRPVAVCLLCACLCVHVSCLCLTILSFTTDSGWQMQSTCTLNHSAALEDKWTSLTHGQRCEGAAFPFECFSKPQATITRVPVCLTAAETVGCGLTALHNDDERQQQGDARGCMLFFKIHWMRELVFTVSF